MNICTIDGCGTGGRIRKGFCNKHYDKYRIYGTTKSPFEKTIKERFDEKYELITESGCWIWNASVNYRGYGKFQLKSNTTAGAHRVSWELHFGKIPDGLYVCHKCDIPSCVNPNHLFLGTAKDNTADMHKKGRSPKGFKRNPKTCSDNAKRKHHEFCSI